MQVIASVRGDTQTEVAITNESTVVTLHPDYGGTVTLITSGDGAAAAMHDFLTAAALKVEQAAGASVAAVVAPAMREAEESFLNGESLTLQTPRPEGAS